MTPIQWSTIIANMHITASPPGLWTPVVEYLPAGTLVRVFAAGRWHYTALSDCSPDGDRVSFVSSLHCLTKEAPPGALIGKIGGGTADLKGAIVPIGSQATFKVGNDGGGLYMTINDAMGGFDDNSGDVVVNVAIQLTAAVGATTA
jgi:hypothetical protein